MRTRFKITFIKCKVLNVCLSLERNLNDHNQVLLLLLLGHRLAHVDHTPLNAIIREPLPNEAALLPLVVEIQDGRARLDHLGAGSLGGGNEHQHARV